VRVNAPAPAFVKPVVPDPLAITPAKVPLLALLVVRITLAFELVVINPLVPPLITPNVSLYPFKSSVPLVTVKAPPEGRALALPSCSKPLVSVVPPVYEFEPPRNITAPLPARLAELLILPVLLSEKVPPLIAMAVAALMRPLRSMVPAVRVRCAL